MKTITMNDLQDPKKVGVFEWLENQIFYKGVALDKLPIEEEVKNWFVGYAIERELNRKKRMKGWQSHM